VYDLLAYLMLFRNPFLLSSLTDSSSFSGRKTIRAISLQLHVRFTFFFFFGGWVEGYSSFWLHENDDLRSIP